MNQIEIIGGKADRKDLAEKVVRWYLKKVMPRIRTFDITIKLTNCLRDGAYGYCFSHSNREFELEIDKNLRMFDFISTLCHELTHLKQYAKGEMKQIDCYKTQWKKVVYTDRVDYENQPWEKEAFKVERQLALECFEEVL